MRKKIFIITFLILANFAFANGNFNLQFGADTASSFTFKPFIGANVSANYTWSNGFGLGCGIKDYWNITSNDKRDLFCGGPYFLLKYKYVNVQFGSFFIENFGGISMYTSLGGEIPIWELKHGKLGLDFGTELWAPVSAIVIMDNSSEENKETSPLDSFKIYLGVTYFLPL